MMNFFKSFMMWNRYESDNKKLTVPLNTAGAEAYDFSVTHRSPDGVFVYCNNIL